MKNILLFAAIMLFSTLSFAGSANAGMDVGAYSAADITSMDGLIGTDSSVVADAVIIDSNSESYNILQTKPMPMMSLDANKTGDGVTYTTDLSCSHPMTHITLHEVGWRIST